MKHIYCISGFGADEKVFSKLIFTGCDVHFIKWIIPLKNEIISDYAKRMAAHIIHDKPILIGLSFGGIMCIEISKLIATEKIILISSIKTLHELPWRMKLAGRLKLNKIFPMKSFKLIEPIENYNLGIETEEEKKLVHQYRRDIDQRYTDWAINIILNWKNEYLPKNLFHIHAGRDRIFPLRNIKADYIIKFAGHFMTLNRSEIINSYLNDILQKPCPVSFPAL